MALAGTAPAWSAKSLEADPKEIREHQIVTDYIDERLSGIGRLRRSARRVVQQASVTHLRTDFQVDLDHTPDLDRLLRRLHPTPALGVWPRNASTMAALAKLRSQCATPRWFGAPFGLKLGSAFHAVVLIRGVFWRGSQIDLPAGCGVLAESTFSQEWSELGWKREATRRLLTLQPTS
jgi:menaquinone-specific isochorismate synthase